ncbi:hypothetical protein MJK72_05825 [Klebsiella pneumoniae]|nr:hypothetical protein MJK72_05825 [Klebsiella pneumoniae]
MRAPGAGSLALQPLLADGKTSHEMHETFRALHQQIRCPTPMSRRRTPYWS